ncbi:DDE superfamily endonuclease domain-containing protein [Phthorimaea operculella]|nr:DDE superfamily endonuclease domain-containing protein [Phthorimaea operculella]
MRLRGNFGALTDQLAVLWCASNNTAVCAEGDVKLELEAEGAGEEERQCDILTEQRQRAGEGEREGGALSTRRNNSIMAATRAKRKRTNYSPECLELALKAIRDEGIGIRESCRKYKVPRTTVQDRLSGRRTDVLKKTGPTPVLGAPGETKVVEWLMHISKCGFPVKKKELLDTVQKILKDLKLPNPFKDDRPGQTWYQSFLKRHPEISARAAEGMRRARAAPTEQSIRLWFRQLETHLAQEAHSDILQHPDRIFSAGECGFSFCPKTGKVLEPKECDGEGSLSIMAAFNACGEQAPLVVVSPEAREWCPLPASDSAPLHWTIGQSDTGRMNSDTFFEYITNDLNTWLECKDTRKPVLLLVDGHSAHMSLALSAMCEEMGIILYALPPNAARLLQPADVSVFAPLTARWRKHRQILLSKPENVNETVTETNFCRLLQDIIVTAETKSNIINGFRRCGLYPFDPNAVDYTKCTTSRDCSRSF